MDLKNFGIRYRSLAMPLLGLALMGLQSTFPTDIRAAETTTIRVFDTVEVEGDQIHLADIADIKCQSRETSKPVGSKKIILPFV
jgi:hypothetical protein